MLGSVPTAEQPSEVRCRATCSGAALCPCEEDADCPNDNPCFGTRSCDLTTAAFVCRLNTSTQVQCATKDVGACHTFACDPADATCKALPLRGWWPMLSGSGITRRWPPAPAICSRRPRPTPK
ncbi:MAG: hypothetical protein H6747_04560 [Deltaproteobacteria bacterium]|nr:hypothetical protein [Deltaproteobacteria bacterium]